MIAQQGQYLYGRGLTAKLGDQYIVLHRGVSLVEPQTNNILGGAANYRATVRVVQLGDPVVLKRLNNRQPVVPGDRLFTSGAFKKTQAISVPPVKRQVNVQIIARWPSNITARQMSLVVLNYGINQGARPGQILDIVRFNDLPVEAFIHRRTPVNWKRKKIGQLVIVRSFDKVSWARVLHANHVVNLLDHAVTS